MKLIIRTIDAHINDEFVQTSPYAHYQKMSMHGQFLIWNNKASVEYVGFYDQSELVGSALIMIKHFLGVFNYAYVPSGLCIDYKKVSLVEAAHQALKEHAKEKRWFLLRIDPNVERVEKNLKGEVVEDGFNNEWVSDTLIKLGYTHKGYGYGYDGSWRDRFTLILDIDKPINEIVENFAKNKKTFYKRQLKMGVTTTVNKEQGIAYLAKFEKQLTQIHGFKPKPVSYFKKVVDTYGEHAHVFVTKMSQQFNIDLIQQELDSGKYDKDASAKQSKIDTLQELKASLNNHGDVIVLAVGLFVCVGDVAWDLYSYKNADFLKYRGTENMHVYAIKYFQQHSVKHYDFVGFSGSTDPSDPYYGLYQYKSSFNPRFVEYIGQFDYRVHETLSNLFINISKVVVKVRRKINVLLYLKKQ